MSSLVNSHDSFSDNKKQTQGISSHGSQLPAELSDNNSWQTVDFPGAIAVDQIPGSTPYLQTNTMDSSSNPQPNSTSQSSAPAPNHHREAELLDLVRDLNECNDVLLAKVSQLEESLERSQAALQAEIDRSGLANGDRDFVQLVTELEQSNQALQHYQMLSETLQTELKASRERTAQLETEHATLRQQSTEQSRELSQATTNCRDLRARLQRQQRYTLQFKAALEKCLSMSPEASSSTASPSSHTSGITMPKVDEIRPWESALGYTKLDPQLESILRGSQTNRQPTSPTDTEAEDQLWHDLARVMEPEETTAKIHGDSSEVAEDSPQFTEPSPWSQSSSPETDIDTEETASTTPSPLSPEASEILARVQSAQAADTYLPAISAQRTPSPLVNPLKPQKRIGSLSAIDLPNFPRLKKQPPAAKA